MREHASRRLNERLALISAVAALLASFFVMTSVSTTEQVTPVHHQSAATYWASALVNAHFLTWLEGDEHDRVEQQIANDFAKALRLSSNRAPILVAMGDADCGPAALRGQFNKTVDSIAHHTPKRAKDIVNDFADQFLEMITHGSRFSEDCYQAAVKLDPKCRLAWLRLVQSNDSQMARRAVDELIRLDADNALPYYLRASFEIEAERVEDALQTVILGNARPFFRSYATEIPVGFEVMYPTNSTTRELGIAGRPLSRHAFAYLHDMEETLWSWADPIQKRIASTHGVIVPILDQPRTVEELALIKPRLIALRDMGQMLMQDETRNSIWMLKGCKLAATFSDGLDRLLESRGPIEELTANKTILDRIRRYQVDYGSYISQLKASLEQHERILLGEFDEMKTRTDILNRIVREFQSDQ